MKEKQKKFLGWRPGTGIYAAAVTVALLLLLYPLIRLANYSVPWYDDYNYGSFARMAMRSAPTLANALKGVRECIHISWYAWQGTYGSIIFMVLMPGIWGEEYYRFGPVFLILLLIISVSLFVYTLLRTVFGSRRVHGIGIGIVSAILALELMHTAQAGIYWYNAGVHYVGMHSFMLLTVSVALRVMYADNRWVSVGLAVPGTALAALTAGGNFVTALQGILVLGTMAGLFGLARRKRTVCILPMLAVYMGGFYLNVSAPGNAKRSASYVGWGMSPAKAVLHSFVEGWNHAWEFTGLMTLAILLLMLPLVWHMVSRSRFAFRFPGLVSLWSVCLYATGFTPSLYSMGHAGLDRTLNAVKLTWQLLLVINLIYWCGWLSRKKRRQSEENMCRWWFYPAVAVAMLISFWVEPDPEGSFSSYGAYYEVHSGLAYNFYQEYLERVELLSGPGDYVELAPYHWEPWLICIGDLSEDPDDESNRALAEWYNKEEVSIVPES